MKKENLLGIPLDLGADSPGVDLGPLAFRYQKIVDKLTRAGSSITDTGNIGCRSRKLLDVGNPRLKFLEEILRVSTESAQRTSILIQRGERAVVLGGDHSICLGVISGASAALEGELGLIYIDAHGDINTAETTPTGNIHGMPLAALMGFGDDRLVNVYRPGRKIAKENMLHIGGADDFDQGELDLIGKENLRFFKMFDMLSNGLKPAFGLIDELCKNVKNIWVSLDLDAVDEIYAPGVGMRNRAGFTYREITTIASYIGQHCNVVGLDVVECNPLTDIDGMTAELGIELIAKLLGRNYSRYSSYVEKNKLQ